MRGWICMVIQTLSFLLVRHGVQSVRLQFFNLYDFLDFFNMCEKMKHVFVWIQSDLKYRNDHDTDIGPVRPDGYP